MTPTDASVSIEADHCVPNVASDMPGLQAHEGLGGEAIERLQGNLPPSLSEPADERHAPTTIAAKLMAPPTTGRRHLGRPIAPCGRPTTRQR